MTTPLTTDVELAETLGISFHTVQKHCNAGSWPHLRVARAFRFTPEHVKAIIAMHEVRPTVSAAASWGRKTRGGAA